MPNKRADNIKRVTITIDEEMLRALEDQCKSGSQNRLEFIREAIGAALNKAKTNPDNKNK